MLHRDEITSIDQITSERDLTLINSANSLSFKNNHFARIHILTRLNKSYPNVAAFAISLAFEYEKTGQANLADKLYTSTVKQFPNDLKANLTYGVYLHRQEEYEAAICFYRELMIKFPTEPEVYLDFSITLSVSGKNNLHEAMKMAKKAILLNPDYDSAHSQLGHCYDLLANEFSGNLSKQRQLRDKARECFEKAKEINPARINRHKSVSVEPKVSLIKAPHTQKSSKKKKCEEVYFEIGSSEKPYTGPSYQSIITKIKSENEKMESKKALQKSLDKRSMSSDITITKETTSSSTESTIHLDKTACIQVHSDMPIKHDNPAESPIKVVDSIDYENESISLIGEAEELMKNHNYLDFSNQNKLSDKINTLFDERQFKEAYEKLIELQEKILKKIDYHKLKSDTFMGLKEEITTAAHVSIPPKKESTKDTHAASASILQIKTKKSKKKNAKSKVNAISAAAMNNQHPALMNDDKSLWSHFGLFAITGMIKEAVVNVINKYNR